MKRQAGFTLIELAVVIFILGLIASMSFAAIKAQLINASNRATKGNQETIKDALVAYLGKYKRLPCPATDTQGGEGRDYSQIPPPNCYTYYGLVPYQTLGLTKSVALDGWDNFFSYAVSPQWAATFSPSPTVQTATITNTATNAFNVGNAGVIVIQDRIQSPSSTPAIPPSAAAMIISHGSNSFGAYTAKGTQIDSSTSGTDEIANRPPLAFASSVAATSPPPGPFFKRDYSDNAALTGGAFDDVVAILTPNDLLMPLIKDGSMKSPEAEWKAQLASIKNSLIGFMISNCKTPPSNSTYAIDPWGGTIGYSSLFSTVGFSGNSSSAVAATYTLSVVSPNPSISPVNGPSLVDVFGNSLSWQNTCP